MTDESVCLDAPERDTRQTTPKVKIMACSGRERQKWEYNEQVRSLLMGFQYYEEIYVVK